MKTIAIIFAGGSGKRIGSEIPKQFLKVYGKEIIIHTLELFENDSEVDEIIIACIDGWITYLKRLIKKFEIKKVVSIVPGGPTGQDSIFLGLKEAKKNNDNAIVLIHDGVRPLVTEETINNCIKSVKKYGNAITVTPCFETPLISYEGSVVNEMPRRKVMYTAHAPQCFYLNDIYAAHLKERKENSNYEGVIDSCSLMFKNGINAHLVIGNHGNIKVTTPEDYCTLIGNLNARDYQEFITLESNNSVIGDKK